MGSLNSIADTTYGSDGVSTVSSPYMDTRGGSFGNPGGINIQDAINFKMQLALRNQAIKEQQAADAHREMILQERNRQTAMDNAAHPMSAATQAAAMGPIATFGVRNPVDKSMQAWYPGMAVGPGQSVDATGYVPYGYEPPKAPQNAGFSGGGGETRSAAADLAYDKEQADKAAYTKALTAKLSGEQSGPDWWGTSSPFQAINDPEKKKLG